MNGIDFFDFTVSATETDFASGKNRAAATSA